MKRKLITLTILAVTTAAVLGAQTFQGWSLNFMMEAFWSAGQTNAFFLGAYQQMVAAGFPCYTWHGSAEPTAQPLCYYDPTNTNSGVIVSPSSANHGPNMPPDPWDWKAAKRSVTAAP